MYCLRRGEGFSYVQICPRTSVPGGLYSSLSCMKKLVGFPIILQLLSRRDKQDKYKKKQPADNGAAVSKICSFPLNFFSRQAEKK